MKFRHVFIAWVLGFYLIFALGAAAIASANAAGNLKLAADIVTPMVSLAMTWFAVFGAPIWAWWIYNTCKGMNTAIQEFADGLTAALIKKKNNPLEMGDVDRLAIPDDHIGSGYYASGFGNCYPLESGQMHLVLFKERYTQDELYRLARWIDVIENDLDRVPLYEDPAGLEEMDQ